MGSESAIVTLIIALSISAGQALATTIEEAVSEAVNSNPSVLGAAAIVRASGHEVRAARAGYYPSLDFDAGYGVEEMNVKQLNLAGNDHGSLDRREAGLTATQLLWDGFATRSEVERRSR